MKVTVVIPTHNPRRDYLERVLQALRAQTLPAAEWELVLVDNASEPPLPSELARLGHPSGRVLRESQLGLTAARLCGFSAAAGNVVVLVDDDNVLAPDYLAQADALATRHPHLGTWSGNVELVLDADAVPPPPAWRGYLTERHCATATWSNDPSHHPSTPWGAGMCVRQPVARAYVQQSRKCPELLRLDLSGSNLVYGGDSDIAYFGCSLGFGKGVFPELHVLHLIPARRCETAYLLRVIEGHAYTEWLHQWLRDGRIPSRRNLLETAKNSARWLLSGAVERRAQSAAARGRRRALRELVGKR